MLGHTNTKSISSEELESSPSTPTTTTTSRPRPSGSRADCVPVQSTEPPVCEEAIPLPGEHQNLKMGNWASLGNSVLLLKDGKSSSEADGCGYDEKTTDDTKRAQINKTHPAGQNLHDEELSIKTFVFLDLESSALKSYDRPKITEVCLVAVHRSSIEKASVCKFGGMMTKPRVLDKLSLCVYPCKQIEPVASDITGLNNPLLLENEKEAFNADVAESICTFLRRQSKPVCLVAHNGYNFDFKLLRTEFDYIGCFLPSDILCCDSLLAFQELEEEKEQNRCTQDTVSDIDVTHVSSNILNNTNGSSENKSVEKSCVAQNTGPPFKKKKHSYALRKVYQRTFGKEPENVHDAESDVISLLQLVLNRGSRICTWMDRHATKWTDIEQYYVPSPKKMRIKAF